MRRVTTRLFLFALVIFTLGLTACRAKETMPGTADEIINTVMKRLKKVKELDADLHVKMDMGISGQPLSANIDSGLRAFKNSMKARMEIHSDMGSGETNENLIYMGKEDETSFVYAKINEVWKRAEVDEKIVTDVWKTYSSGQADAILENKDLFTIKEEVTEEGRDFTILEGRLDVGNLQELIKGVGLSEQMGMDFGQIDANGLEEDVKVTLWIDGNSVTLYRVILDLTEFMEIALKEIMAAVVDTYAGNLNEKTLEKQGLLIDQMQIKVNHCEAGIQYNKFYEVEEFKIPEEALKADTMEIHDLFDIFGKEGTE